MFLLKKNKTAEKSGIPLLTLFDKEMKLLFSDSLNAFPLPETVILACSEEFFSDPCPCEIHRRAVQLRLYAEFSMMIPKGQTLSMDSVPPCISLYCQEYHPSYIRLE